MASIFAAATIRPKADASVLELKRRAIETVEIEARLARLESTQGTKQ
jgi:hypothetical protein